MDPPVFAEKVRRPDSRRIDRPRLERRLLADDAPPLALVLAPPGSGKTTLLSAAAAATRPSAWYRAEAEDHTEPAFVRHVAQSLRSAGVLPVASGLPLTVTALVDALESAEALPATLVVDDVHEIAATPAETALERFVLHRTRALRLMLGSRRPPALNTPRLMVSGELLQLDGEDLRFRSWEVEELFRDLYDRPLSPSAAAALTRRTGGWAAGLRLFQLATSALNRAERERAVEELSGRSRLIRSYLARNVLAGLAEDQLAFLLHTCTLGELTGDLCDELLDSQGSAEVLEALEQAQFFTTSSDGGTTFQYHQVLQTHLEVLLVDRFGPQVARARYARSAELLERSGRVGAAIRAYGRAEDWVAVRRMLRQTSSALVPDDVPRWGPLDPAGPTVDDPSLGVAAARRLLRSGHVREAVAAYQHAESLLDDPEFRNRCADERAVAAVWLPEADDLAAPQRQTGPRALRLARQLRHATRSLRDLDEPALDLAAGLRLLLAGRSDDAQRAFDRALDDPEATPVERQVARLASRLAALGGAASPPPGQLDELVPPDPAGLPWLARLSRGIEAAVLLVQQPSEGRLIACAEVLADCARADGWTRCLLHQVVGASYCLIGRLDLAGPPLWLAARTAQELGAPVLQVWAEAWAVSARDSSVEEGAAPGAALAVARRARALGAAGAATIATSGPGPARRLPTWSPEPVPPPAPARPRAEARPPAAPAGAVTLRCLGSFALTVGEVEVDLRQLRPRARNLLMLLALHHGQDQHRERLVDLLWPGSTLVAGTRSLQVAVSSIRQCLSGVGLTEQALRRTGDAYALVLPAVDDQLRRFELLAARAVREAETSDPRTRLSATTSALELYVGDLLPEAGPAEWVVEERQRLRDLAARLATGTARSALGLGDLASALVWVRRSLALDPYQDPAWRLLAEAHELLGDRSGAAVARREHARVQSDLGLLVAQPVTTAVW